MSLSVLDRLAGGGAAIEARRRRPVRWRSRRSTRSTPSARTDELPGRAIIARRGRPGTRAAAGDVPRARRVRAPRATELLATEELIAAALFGERPAAEALIAESDGELVGYAIFFPTFSTFLAMPGIWLEDIYVRPAAPP